MDAVRVNGALAEQPEMVIDVDIAAAPGIELRHPHHAATSLAQPHTGAAMKDPPFTS